MLYSGTQHSLFMKLTSRCPSRSEQRRKHHKCSIRGNVSNMIFTTAKLNFVLCQGKVRNSCDSQNSKPPLLNTPQQFSITRLTPLYNYVCVGKNELLRGITFENCRSFECFWLGPLRIVGVLNMYLELGLSSLTLRTSWFVSWVMNGYSLLKTKKAYD